MIKYLKVKKMEIEFKYALYSSVRSIIKEQAQLLALMQRLYAALQDVPEEELKNEFVSKMAEIVHEANRGKEE